MNRQFTLYITPTNAYTAGASVDLPAMPYALQDALDKARILKGKGAFLSIDGCSCEALEEVYAQRESEKGDLTDIYALNALAEKMSQLDTWNLQALDGMIRIEMKQSGPNIPISRLYDLACSTGHLNYAAASNDAALGKFFAEAGFLPEMDDLPDEVFDKLDFAKIGKERREADGGIFLMDGSGYIEHDGEIAEEFKGLDLTPKKPDYTVLLEIGVPDHDITGMLKLPAPSEKITAVFESLAEEGFRDVSWRCADCKISAMADLFSMSDCIKEINEGAKVLDGLSDNELIVAKALLAVGKPNDLTEAFELIETRDQYLIAPQYYSASDIGRSRLNWLLSMDEAQALIPHVNLEAYGREQMARDNQITTDYGIFERWDHMPIQLQEQNSAQERGGLEMR